MSQLRSNFRGARACLILPEDSNREILARTLTRLGLLCHVMSQAEASASEESFDIVFFDSDQEFDPLPQDAPHVALIGIEAPSRLSRVVRAQACAWLPKPVRVAGIFSTLFFAFNLHAARQTEQQEKLALQRRAEGRRLLIKALLLLMTRDGLTEDEAYRQLRMEAMRRRLPIETWAAEMLAAEVSSSSASPRPSGLKLRK